MTDQLEQGLPLVGGYVLIDEMQAEADQSGYDELSGLVNELNVAWSSQDPNDPAPSDEFLAAGRDLQAFCDDHASAAT